MQTIIALSTSVENSTICLIRISGNKAIKLTERLINKKIKKEQRILKNLYINNNFVDEVVINFYYQPNSFTGENVVEINCHANKIIVEEIINFYVKNGCSNAKGGEFIEQAFINGKLTFKQAQIINEIIKSNNKMVLDIYRNKYLTRQEIKILQNIRDKISQLIMKGDMSVEYPEYKEFEIDESIIKEIDSIENMIQTQLEQIKIIEKLNKGFIVSLVGKPNVGKSTLFNKLLKKDRSIVTNIPGTTTDYIEDWIILPNGVKITLVDTAGIRVTKKEIEKKGVDKSFNVIKDSDIIINLLENFNEKVDERIINSNKKVFNVITKKDKLKKISKKHLYISSFNGEGIRELINLITEEINKNITILKNREIAFISNKSKLLEQLSLLNEIKDGLKKGNTFDIFRSQLDQCLNIANTLIGEGKTYNYVEEIFRTFCIGK